MKKIKYLLVLVMVITIGALVFTGCGITKSGGSSDDDQENRPPVIVSFTANPSTVDGPGSSTLITIATDADGDDLNYTYEKISGLNGNLTPYSSTANYTAYQDGTHIIKVTVDDNNENSTNATVTVNQINVCFVAGTKVSTPLGFKNIEDFQAGDEVYAYNEKTKSVVTAKVNKPTKRTAGKIYTVYIGKDKLKVTGAHPFYVVGKGWVKVAELTKDDTMLMKNGETKKIKKIRSRNKNTEVYNIEVAKYRNYFAGKEEYLVHNY